MQLPHVVYLLYDAADVLLYVGISCQPSLRLQAHRNESVWWSQVATATLHHTRDRAAALELERRWIEELKPLYNVPLKGRRRGGPKRRAR